MLSPTCLQTKIRFLWAAEKNKPKASCLRCLCESLNPFGLRVFLLSVSAAKLVSLNPCRVEGLPFIDDGCHTSNACSALWSKIASAAVGLNNRTLNPERIEGYDCWDLYPSTPCRLKVILDHIPALPKVQSGPAKVR